MTVEAIKEFTAQFFQIASVKHSMIEVWNTPLMGDVVPVNLAPARSASTVTVVSTALPTFSVDIGSAVTHIAVPATSIFLAAVEVEFVEGALVLTDPGLVGLALRVAEQVSAYLAAVVGGPIEVESDYLPKQLLKGTWLGLFRTHKNNDAQGQPRARGVLPDMPADRHRRDGRYPPEGPRSRMAEAAIGGAGLLGGERTPHGHRAFP
ncbi:hypothetical protein SSP24_56260 [Streptomyces spinoverrucosus]|uniref:Uncharacterized protein n=1 Tax=Streptomyces spinoverrucosus TaxID=284043 RepID=A0A4Y3VQH0_9ACTN|nr:hypothetical protein [Streptomyces spinoverrucosus]GEC07971.1 hypothetical protein SSP24_56260 [Streptomyces spinoverrucosus]GHB89405.1 hypothetical protein GCM10010397_71940 [Streptomyces spinoverrucosus]